MKEDGLGSQKRNQVRKYQIKKGESYLSEDVSIHRTNLKYCGKSPKIQIFTRLLKHANFHLEYYPSCVTSCDDCTKPTVFL